MSLVLVMCGKVKSHINIETSLFQLHQHLSLHCQLLDISLVVFIASYKKQGVYVALALLITPQLGNSGYEASKWFLVKSNLA